LADKTKVPQGITCTEMTESEKKRFYSVLHRHGKAMNKDEQGNELPPDQEWSPELDRAVPKGSARKVDPAATRAAREMMTDLLRSEPLPAVSQPEAADQDDATEWRPIAIERDEPAPRRPEWIFAGDPIPEAVE